MKRILVIDDEEMVRKVVSRLLSAAGYDVQQAENGVAGLEKLKTYLPDLVIMDVMMPELDGISTCHVIKNSPHTANIPVLFLSGLDTIGETEKALEEHPEGYITKPCDPARLLKKVESIISL